MTIEQMIEEESLTMCIGYRGIVFQGDLSGEDKDTDETHFIPPPNDEKKENPQMVSFLISFGGDWNFDICVAMENGKVGTESIQVSEEKIMTYLETIPQNFYIDELQVSLLWDLVQEVRRIRTVYNNTPKS